MGRRATAKSKLTIQWTSSAHLGERRLSSAEVLAELRGDDTRPLLVWVQRAKASNADKTKSQPTRKKRGKRVGDDEKLRRLTKQSLDNERVQLASDWFNCVKLGPEVLDKRHPFHALFSNKKNPARIVLASANGKKLVQALGTSKDRLDWRDIVGVLKQDYRKDPARAIKELQRLLTDYDTIDVQRADLQKQLEKATAKKKASSAKRLARKIKALDDKLEKLQARESKIRELQRRRSAP